MTHNNISPSYVFVYPYHKSGGMAKWTKAADCKSVILGSNPSAACFYYIWRGGWWNGRHEGLKIPSSQGGEGSTPSPPTKHSTDQDSGSKSNLNPHADTLKPSAVPLEPHSTINKQQLFPQSYRNSHKKEVTIFQLQRNVSYVLIVFKTKDQKPTFHARYVSTPG